MDVKTRLKSNRLNSPKYRAELIYMRFFPHEYFQLKEAGNCFIRGYVDEFKDYELRDDRRYVWLHGSDGKIIHQQCVMFDNHGGYPPISTATDEPMPRWSHESQYQQSQYQLNRCPHCGSILYNDMANFRYVCENYRGYNDSDRNMHYIIGNKTCGYVFYYATIGRPTRPANLPWYDWAFVVTLGIKKDEREFIRDCVRLPKESQGRKGCVTKSKSTEKRDEPKKRKSSLEDYLMRLYMLIKKPRLFINETHSIFIKNRNFEDRLIKKYTEEEILPFSILWDDIYPIVMARPIEQKCVEWRPY